MLWVITQRQLGEWPNQSPLGSVLGRVVTLLFIHVSNKLLTNSYSTAIRELTAYSLILYIPPLFFLSFSSMFAAHSPCPFSHIHLLNSRPRWSYRNSCCSYTQSSQEITHFGSPFQLTKASSWPCELYLHSNNFSGKLCNSNPLPPLMVEAEAV